jgi:hypothetical protein
MCIYNIININLSTYTLDPESFLSPLHNKQSIEVETINKGDRDYIG